MFIWKLIYYKGSWQVNGFNRILLYFNGVIKNLDEDVENMNVKFSAKAKLRRKMSEYRVYIQYDRLC